MLSVKLIKLFIFKNIAYARLIYQKRSVLTMKAKKRDPPGQGEVVKQ